MGYSNFFSRDPFTIGNLLIEGNLRFQHRRQEILPIRPIIQQWTQEAEGYYFAAPQPDTSEGILMKQVPLLKAAMF